MGFGQFAATTQFYLFGRKHCTATGYQRAAAKYGFGADLEKLSLSGKFYAVTGANSGVGLSLTNYLAAQGASVFMVCRSRGRAEEARDNIIKETGNDKVKLIVADMSLKSGVSTCVQQLSDMAPHLDGLICNAGVLLNERTETTEGIEVTFATHLAVGVYMLTRQLLPLLRKAPARPRVIFVSSGGMYNTAWPGAAKAGSTGGQPYGGNMAYAYAKRGQVLLAEQLSTKVPDVSFVSCHPGWTDTPAVDAAYGKQKKLLEPMRTPWQGAEGIAWLSACDANELEGGAFYLDRKPQVKHIAGVFFTEGSFTKNTPAQVDEMMESLQTVSGLEPLELAPPQSQTAPATADVM